MRNRLEPLVFRAAIGAAASTFALTIALSAQAAPADYGDTSPKFTDAATQPLRDLNITQKKLAPSLREAKAAPYDLTDMGECEAITSEIAELDSVLGPDVDAAQPAKSHMVKSLATDALSSAIKIPFRGVIRTLSGAERNDRERQEAYKAGMARRAFLKGVAAAKCRGDDVPYLRVADAHALAAQPRQAPAEPVQTRVAANEEAPPAPPAQRRTRYVWVATPSGPQRSSALTYGPPGQPSWVSERAAYSSARYADPDEDDGYGQVEAADYRPGGR